MMRSLLRICGWSGAGMLLVSALHALSGRQGALSWSVLSVLGGVLLAVWVIGDWDRIALRLESEAARYELRSALGVVLVLLLATGLAALAQRWEVRADLSPSRLHSLSEDSLKLLERVDRPVRIEVYAAELSPDRPELERLARLYERASEQISVELVDPNREPWRLTENDVGTDGTVLIKSGARVERWVRPDEEDLSNALLRVLKDERKRVLFSSGHGERDLRSDAEAGLLKAAAALADQGYAVEQVNLLETAEVPGDAAVLVVAAPERALGAREAERIREYVEAGGGLMVLAEPGQETGLEGVLEAWGLRLEPGIIVDLAATTARGVPTEPITDSFMPHEITTGLKVPAFFRGGRPVGVSEELPKGVIAWPVVLTAREAFAEQDLSAEPRFDEGVDLLGPFAVLAAAEVRVPGAGAEGDAEFTRVVLAGDADWAANSTVALLGNAQLFANSVAYLARELELVDVLVYRPDERALELTEGGALLYVVFAVAGLPGVLLGAAFVLWWGRRKL